MSSEQCGSTQPRETMTPSPMPLPRSVLFRPTAVAAAAAEQLPIGLSSTSMASSCYDLGHDMQPTIMNAAVTKCPDAVVAKSYDKRDQKPPSGLPVQVASSDSASVDLLPRRLHNHNALSALLPIPLNNISLLSPVTARSIMKELSPSSRSQHYDAMSKSSLALAVPVLDNDGTIFHRDGVSLEFLPLPLSSPLAKGVTFRPSGKWQVQLFYAGHSRYIGVFGSKQQAVAAYKRAKECCDSFNKVDPTPEPEEIRQNIEFMCKAACGGGALRLRQKPRKQSKKIISSSTQPVPKVIHLSPGVIKEGKKRQRLDSSTSKPTIVEPKQKTIHSSSYLPSHPLPNLLTGSSSDEENSDLNRLNINSDLIRLGKDRKHIVPKKNNNIGGRCPCICTDVDCAAIIKARKAMGLDDGRIELPSMDLLKKRELSCKDKLDASILTSAMGALGLNVGHVKTKKNRIQCDHYSIDVRHRLRRTRGVVYVACKFFTSDGRLVIPKQSTGDRIAELNMLQVIHSKAPASFAMIKDGLIGKGNMVVTKEMLWTIYIGLVNPQDKVVPTMHEHDKEVATRVDGTGVEHGTARVLPDLSRELEEASESRGCLEDNSVRSADAMIDAKSVDGMHQSAVKASPELDSMKVKEITINNAQQKDDRHSSTIHHRKRSKNVGSDNVDAVTSCGVEGGLAFLLQACEKREGNF